MKLKPILLLILLPLLGYASADILVTSEFCEGEETQYGGIIIPPECRGFHFVDLDNPEAGETCRWAGPPFHLFHNTPMPLVVTAGPDEMIYLSSVAGYPSSEDKKLYRFPLGDISKTDIGQDVELVAISSASCRPENPDCIPEDWAVRIVNGEPRYYYSVDAGGAVGDPKIYYIDEEGNSHLYYDVDLSRIPIRCGDDEGNLVEQGYWEGDFTFDDANNVLYLSSGETNHASIFKITEAYPDRVEGDTIEEIIISVGFKKGIEFVAPNSIYFEFNNVVYRFNVNDYSDRDVVYTTPSSRFLEGFAVVGTSAPSIPQPRKSAITQIRRPPDDMVKKGKKVDIVSERVSIRATPSASKYVAIQADSEQTTSKQRSIAANVGS